ncbi:signal peptidase I [Marinimicrobium sp. ABcell2]|uniref:signal peptidase I n=1 Tax=Marinimicrobium sp. ABcell2 TaxID=3069751 RepID=UPI0027B6602F|nr:signal peptidase I [Marinimicrobium sp. ABcell2]MDQ2075385.1 signal peptidase I [Marinimicrobium sp. ABcell2]
MSSINLPLILTLAVFITGLIWLYDILVLAPPRKRRLAAIRQQFENVNLDDEHQKRAYNDAQLVAAREPTVVEYSKSFFPVLLLVFVLRSFILEPFQIPSSSMEPTLNVGDFLVVNKFTYGLRLPVLNKRVIPVNDPQRGDVMVFFPPHLPDTYFIKRVIGIPGDHVEYIDHVLTINGQPVEEETVALMPEHNPQYRVVRETLGDKEYTVHKNLTPGRYSRHGSWEVPEGHYFMMGDNRDASFDSRGWNELNPGSAPDLAFVSEDAIVGKAVAVWMHWHPVFSLPSFEPAGRIH